MKSFSDLLRGEVLLTLNLVGMTLLGEFLLRRGWLEWLASPLSVLFRRRPLSSIVRSALLISIGSSRIGSTLLATAWKDGRINDDEAFWGTLSLSFPGYLRRWVTTMASSVALAGWAGLWFSLMVLLRSALRFIWFFRRIPRSSEETLAEGEAPSPRTLSGPIWRPLMRTLPLAWLFYGLTWWLVPLANDVLTRSFAGSWMPLAGWAVAAAGMGNLTASLAAAGGALATGELTTIQALVALLLGSGLSSLTLALRQNAAWWMGLYPLPMARSLLLWSLSATALCAFLSLIPPLILMLL